METEEVAIVSLVTPSHYASFPLTKYDFILLAWHQLFLILGHSRHNADAVFKLAI